MGLPRTDTCELALLRESLGGLEARLAECDRPGALGWVLLEADVDRLRRVFQWRGEIKARLAALLLAAEARGLAQVREALAALSTYVNSLETSN